VPGDSCQPIDSHTVRCVPRPDLGQVLFARVVLGDMDDSLTVEGLGDRFVGAEGGPGNDRLVGANVGSGGPGDDELVAPAFFFSIEPNRLYGGSGDDRLLGGASDDELRGGGGVDDLSGGDGSDRLLDGDVDGALGDAGPGPDRFDGGAGTDTVSYAPRTAPVSADIAAGEGAEGDRFANVESLTGGRGDDQLSGDGLPNVLDGHRGQDRLSGRGGSDEFRRAGGPVSCGAQEDTVLGGRSSRDRLEPDCEFLTPDYDAQVRANPVWAFRRSVRFRIECSYVDDEEFSATPHRCGPGALRLREVAGKRRILASMHLPAGDWAPQFMDVGLTRVGRRLASRTNGVWARVRLAGYYREGPALRWTIRLKVPR
jgi:hypothetical protein